MTEWDKTIFERIADILKLADCGLYDAKHAGRNCVVVQQNEINNNFADFEIGI